MWFTLALISALFSAAASIFEKKSLQTTQPLSFSFILAVFNLVLSLPLLIWIDFDAISLESLGVLFFKSVLAAFSFLLIMNGLKKMELSSALPLLVLTPGLVAFFAYLFLGESLNNMEIVGMLILLLGTYFLQIKKGKGFFAPFQFVKKNKAYWYIIGALILFTITSLLDKSLLKNYKMSPEAIIPLQHIFFVFNFSVMLLFNPAQRQDIPQAFKGTWKLILLISVMTIIYRYSQMLAIKEGSVALVLAIKRTSVFFAIVIGGRYFKEGDLPRKILATSVMVVGAIVIYLN